MALPSMNYSLPADSAVASRGELREPSPRPPFRATNLGDLNEVAAEMSIDAVVSCSSSIHAGTSVSGKTTEGAGPTALSADEASEQQIKTLIWATNKSVRQNIISHWAPNQHQILIMATLSLISLMVALDACIIVTSLNAIIADLKFSTTSGLWIGTSYLLTNAVTMPFLAELSNIFGRPVVLLGSLCFFTIGTILCCLAQDLAVLLAGRVLQGVGGGGIMVLSLVIFTDMVPLRWRPKWYSFVLGAWALGNCIGPIIGGAVAQNTTWRWVFYLMFPLCIIGLVLVFCLLKFRAPPRTMLEKVRRVDWAGGLFFIAYSTSFLVAISWGGLQFSWRSPGTLVPLCIGAFGIVATLYYEAAVAKRPFLRRSLFSSASSVVTYICGAIQGFLIYGQLYYVPLYFLSVKGYKPITTGVAILPVMLTCIPSSMITGMLVTRTGNYRRPIWAGWVLLLVGSGLTTMFGKSTSVAVWVIILIILGFGHGTVLNAQNFASQAMCKRGEEGHAAAMYAFLRQFGMALGVGVGGAIFQNALAAKLRWGGLDATIATNSEAYMQELWKMSSGSTYKSDILDAYVFGLRAIYLFYTCICAIGLLLSLFSKQFEMREEIESEHVLEEMAFELS